MKTPKILSAASGATIVSGLERLSSDEEKALNLLLRRAGGEIDGVPFFKIGWAMEDNFSHWDSSKNSFVYEPEKKTPICFDPNQAAYHFLAWEPPSSQFEELVASGELKGEKIGGTYNCLFHFLDRNTQRPNKPTIQLIEVIIPVMKQFAEIAFASSKGFDATVQQIRTKKIQQLKDNEEKKSTDYEKFADSLLEDSKPAFEGNPTSFQGKKRRTFSDLMPGERPRHRKTTGEPQPKDFAFSVKSRKEKK